MHSFGDDWVHIEDLNNLGPAKLVNLFSDADHHLDQGLLVRVMELRGLLVHVQKLEHGQKRVKHPAIQRLQNRRIRACQHIPENPHLRYLILKQIGVCAQRRKQRNRDVGRFEAERQLLEEGLIDLLLHLVVIVRALEEPAAVNCVLVVLRDVP